MVGEAEGEAGESSIPQDTVRLVNRLTSLTVLIPPVAGRGEVGKPSARSRWAVQALRAGG